MQKHIECLKKKVKGPLKPQQINLKPFVFCVEKKSQNKVQYAYCIKIVFKN